jgi:hypothetical protein
MGMSEKKCEACEFYCDGSPREGKGQCRFNAPFPSLKSAMMSEKFFSEASITWPTVQPTDWCGHFSPASR